MATIGTFKKTGNNEFTGEIVTLSVQAKNVRIAPDQRATGENAPSHRVLVGRAEIGAAWSKTSNEGRNYLGLSRLRTIRFAGRKSGASITPPPSSDSGIDRTSETGRSRRPSSTTNRYQSDGLEAYAVIGVWWG